MRSGTITREKILQAALEVFTHQGYEGARMEKIASMVGINKASLYFHFKSKEDIFRELFLDILEKYQNMLTTVIDESRGLNCRERFTVIYKRYLDYNLIKGRTPAQGALAWIWSKSNITIPIPGFKTVK